MGRTANHDDSFESLEASSIFCPHCEQAQPVLRKLLLVLPQGDKVAYFCKVCGARLGDKIQESPAGRGYNLT